MVEPTAEAPFLEDLFVETAELEDGTIADMIRVDADDLAASLGGPGSGPRPHGGTKKPEKKDDDRGPSSPNDRQESKLPIKPFTAPPDPQGTGGRKAGGFTANGETNTSMGDLAEKALTQLGLRSILPEGKRQNPLDVEDDHSGHAYEVKACSTTATEYKCKAKKAELDDKRAYADEHQLKPGIMIPVVDRDKGEMHVYSREGLGNYKLDPKTAEANGWRYHGTVKLTGDD